MPLLICYLLWVFGAQVAAKAVSVAKREVLTDLSGGFCRNYKFGATIVNDVLYMNGLDGGILPDDHNGSINYLIELDLSSRIDLTDRANYKLHLIPYNIPKLKRPSALGEPSQHHPFQLRRTRCEWYAFG
ncbi:hypothetical protein BDV10DRAFT_128310 [Aspergillus recurvatus]